MASTGSNSTAVGVPAGPPLLGVEFSRIIIDVAASLSSVGTVLLAIRIYTRYYVLGIKNPGWSLSSAIVAWLLSIPTSVLWAVAAKYGLGNHIELVMGSPHLSTALLCEWIGVSVSLFAAWFGKLSALLYTLDVQGPTHRNRRWILFILIGVNLLLNIGMIPILFTQCTPVQKQWIPQLAGDCAQGPRAWKYATVTGAWGALTDLVLALYPVAMIQSLQLKRRVKALLCVLLGLGVFTAGCAILKTIFFCAFKVYGDLTWDNGPFVLWSLAEVWVILIAASVPPIWPAVQRAHSSVAARIGGSSNCGAGGGSGSGSRRLKDGSSGSGSRVGAARHYFYNYDADERRGHASIANSPFGEWGVLVSRASKEEIMTIDDGIRVTRNVSMSSIYRSDEERVEK